MKVPIRSTLATEHRIHNLFTDYQSSSFKFRTTASRWHLKVHINLRVQLFLTLTGLGSHNHWLSLQLIKAEIMSSEVSERWGRCAEDRNPNPARYPRDSLIAYLTVRTFRKSIATIKKIKTAANPKRSTSTSTTTSHSARSVPLLDLFSKTILISRSRYSTKSTQNVPRIRLELAPKNVRQGSSRLVRLPW